jgi:hypothetical protein
MSYVHGTEMNTMPQLMCPRLRGAYAYAVRKTSWREVGTRIFARHGSGWGEELS